MTRFPGLLFALTAAAPDRRQEVLGVWRGTSLCVRPDAGPACHDETTVYRFAPIPEKPELVRLSAYKVVDGEEAFMGDLGACAVELHSHRTACRTPIASPCLLRIPHRYASSARLALAARSAVGCDESYRAGS